MYWLPFHACWHLWEENWSVADDCSADEVKLEDGKSNVHGHPSLVALHACCRRCHVKVLPEVSFVIFVRAKNKDWLKAVYESCATSAFWGLSPLREGEDQIICVKCLMAAYYLCILWDCFESSMVLLSAHIDPHLFNLLYFLPSTVWFVALLSSRSYLVALAQVQPLKLCESFRCLYAAQYFTLPQKCQWKWIW